MGAKEKRKKELQQAVDKRKADVIKAAKEVFREKTIEKTTMQDIALRAEIGVASVYRYYSSKKELVSIVASHYLKDSFTRHKINEKATGFIQVEEIIDYVIDLFLMNGPLFLFMEQYENYEKSCRNLVRHYLETKEVPLLIEAIHKGVKDGSICLKCDPEVFSKQVMHMLLTIGQKLFVDNQKNFPKNEQDFRSELGLFRSFVMTYIGRYG